MASPQGIATAMLNIERLGTGYSQGRRWSFVKDRNARPLTLIAGKAADCSAAVGAAVALAGYPVDLSGIFYTGNQRERLTAAGAQDLPFSKAACQVGDILWRDGHTEIVTSPGYQTGARFDENGQSSGGVDGDQTGQEFATSPLSSNWTRILRFKNTDTKDGFLMALTDAEQKKLLAWTQSIHDILTGYAPNKYVQKGYSLPLIGSRVRDVKDYISGGGPRGEDATLLRQILDTQEAILNRLNKLEGK